MLDCWTVGREFLKFLKFKISRKGLFFEIWGCGGKIELFSGWMGGIGPGSKTAWNGGFLRVGGGGDVGFVGVGFCRGCRWWWGGVGRPPVSSFSEGTGGGILFCFFRKIMGELFGYVGIFS